MNKILTYDFRLGQEHYTAEATVYPSNEGPEVDIFNLYTEEGCEVEVVPEDCYCLPGGYWHDEFRRAVAEHIY